jgi:hypothetical protein
VLGIQSVVGEYLIKHQRVSLINIYETTCIYFEFPVVGFTIFDIYGTDRPDCMRYSTEYRPYTIIQQHPLHTLPCSEYRNTLDPLEKHLRKDNPNRHFYHGTTHPHCVEIARRPWRLGPIAVARSTSDCRRRWPKFWQIKRIRKHCRSQLSSPWNWHCYASPFDPSIIQYGQRLERCCWRQESRRKQVCSQQQKRSRFFW